LFLDPAGVEVDVLLFEQLVAEGSLDSLERAMSLYRGELLQGLAAQGPQPSAFEEWLAGERERLRELALEALAKLVTVQRTAGSPERALSTTLRLLTLDPLQEAAHRTAMRLYAQLGRRTAALRQYQACVNSLRRELNVEPEEETRELYRDILRRRPILAATGLVPASAAWPPAASAFEDNVPLIGRELETARLRAWLAKASSGSCQVALLVGETGGGKSRLVAKLVSEAGSANAELKPPPFSLLLGRCHEGEQILAFGPWIDAFRTGRLSGERALLDKLEPVWRAELVRLLPELRGPEDPLPSDPPDAARLFEAVRQLMACLTNRSPVVIVLEDLHWADEMSLRLLQFLVRRTAGLPLLLVGTVREEELPDQPFLRQTLDSLDGELHVERIRVPPLSRRTTLQLVRALSSTTSEPAAVERVAEKVWRTSEGNPFVVVETMRALHQGFALTGPGGLPIAERVRLVISRRLDRLSGVARELAAVSAIIGRGAQFSVLPGATGLDEATTATAVEELVRHQVLHEVGGGLDFVHERVRGVVYAELVGPRRRLLHRQVAEAFERLHAADLEPYRLALGTHYREGEVWEKAATHLRHAGTKAVSRSAHREAATCFEQALEALQHLSRSRDSLELAVDLRHELGNVLLPLGRLRRLLDVLHEADPLARSLGDDHRRARIASRLSNCFWWLGDPQRGIAAGEDAVCLATACGDADGRLVASFHLGLSYHQRGDYARAAELNTEIVAALTGDRLYSSPGGISIQSVVSRTMLTWSLAELGRFSEGCGHGQDGIRIAEISGHQGSEMRACFALGQLHLRQGDLPRAIALLVRSVSLSRIAEAPLWFPLVASHLGYARALAGHLAAAIPLLERAVEQAAAEGHMAYHALQVAHLSEGYLSTGRVEDAAIQATRALELSQTLQARGDRAWVLRLLGEIGMRRDPLDAEQANAHYQQALTLANELGMCPLVAHCHVALGKLYARAGRHHQAQEHLASATTMYREMDMRFWLEQAESEIRAFG
jgi:tetratricopeptide (TPR) repeat protein